MKEENVQNLKVGLALSGGGVRAAVFHLGVLARLAEEEEIFKNIKALSTVSGGSLVVGMLYAARKNDQQRDIKFPQSTNLKTKFSNNFWELRLI